MARSRREPSDGVDAIIAAWAGARPDLDLRMFGVYLRLQRMQFAFRHAIDATTRTSELKSGELLVLLALRRAAPSYAMRPTDLFKTLLVTSGAMTKRVDRLVRFGYVERVPAGRDRRSWLIRLTQPGYTLADRAITGIAAYINGLMARVDPSPAEMARIEGLTRRILAVLDRDEAAPGRAPSGVKAKRPRARRSRG